MLFLGFYLPNQLIIKYFNLKNVLVPTLLSPVALGTICFKTKVKELAEAF